MEDVIFNHYRSKQNHRPFYDFSKIKEAKELNLTTLNIGLGDAIALTCLTQQ